MNMHDLAAMLRADVFAAEDFDAVINIYDKRPGGYETVDRSAVDAILAKYPHVAEEHKDHLKSYAALITR